MNSHSFNFVKGGRRVHELQNFLVEILETNQNVGNSSSLADQVSEHQLRYRADGVDMAGNLSHMTVNFFRFRFIRLFKKASTIIDFLKMVKTIFKETGRYTYGMFKEKVFFSKLAQKTDFFYQQAAHVQDLFGKSIPKPKQTGMTQLNGKVH